MSLATSHSHALPVTSTSHPDNPIPEEPLATRRLSVATSSVPSTMSRTHMSDNDSVIESDPTTPDTDFRSSDESGDDLQGQKLEKGKRYRRRASTILVSEDSEDVRRFMGESGAATKMLQRACCGGGCCMERRLKLVDIASTRTLVEEPQNDAYKSLNINIGYLSMESELTDIAELPDKTVSFQQLGSTAPSVTQSELPQVSSDKIPPTFVKPHPPYDVYSAPLFHARELTKPGAEKRTYHFDIDVTDYPAESGDVDFVVGGAIGVCPSNRPELVEAILERLMVPRFLRDKPVLLQTTNGRWPTIWGEDEAREIVTTRRELLTWCSDIQSYPPTKALLRLMADHTIDQHEKKILTYMASAQGQAAFCDLRTGSYVTLLQLLSAFPSSTPPLDHLLSNLNQLMPRFYSLSQDPLVSCERDGTHSRRLVEIAVSVHETEDWKDGTRTGTGSGFLERLARQVIQAEKDGIDPNTLDLRVPMFRGLMANPLAREFVSDGPMLLVGAGVGIAPFRGFVHRRLKSANCANKVWVLQGVRDSLVDELYSGDWGVHEDKVKKVVQSRRGESKYVQEEVRAQADLVWFIINALDGRIFVCGSSKGMGEGVERALIDVAMGKGGLNEEEAVAFWNTKKSAGQYIAETW